MLNEGSRVSVTSATKQSTLKVLSRGNYFLPYVLLEKQSEIAPLRLGDSEGVTVNDNVYMVGDEGAISAGKVTGTTTVKGARAFLISLANQLRQQRHADFQPQWRSDRHSGGESRRGWRRFGLFFFSARQTKAIG